MTIVRIIQPMKSDQLVLGHAPPAFSASDLGPTSFAVPCLTKTFSFQQEANKCIIIQPHMVAPTRCSIWDYALLKANISSPVRILQIEGPARPCSGQGCMARSLQSTLMPLIAFIKEKTPTNPKIQQTPILKYLSKSVNACVRREKTKNNRTLS